MDTPYRNDEINLDIKPENIVLYQNETIQNNTNICKYETTIIIPIIELIIQIISVLIFNEHNSGWFKELGLLLVIGLTILNELISTFIICAIHYLHKTKDIGFFALSFTIKSIFLCFYLNFLFSLEKEMIIIFIINITFYVIYFLIYIIYLIIYYLIIKNK